MMKGIGTAINVICILIGGCLGLLFKKALKESTKTALLNITGIAILFMGIDGAVEQMHVQNNASLILILSLTIGCLVGEFFHLEDMISQFGEWLKIKTGNQKDHSFVSGFVHASCVVSIGAMAVIGSIQDGIYADSSILIAKGILDFIIIALMSSSQGKGCIFSLIPVALFQGSLTYAASLFGSFMPTSSLDSLSLVGSVLIFCVGLNLIREKQIKVANLLPALILAIILPIFI